MEKFIVSGYARLVLFRAIIIMNYYQMIIITRDTSEDILVPKMYPGQIFEDQSTEFTLMITSTNFNVLIQNDSMKKLIEKYAEMENVIPEAIQLIFKGNPVTKDDTPNKLEITSEDILEVCKVPGIFIPAKKPSTPSPADMDESSKFGYV